MHRLAKLLDDRFYHVGKDSRDKRSETCEVPNYVKWQVNRRRKFYVNVKFEKIPTANTVDSGIRQ